MHTREPRHQTSSGYQSIWSLSYTSAYLDLFRSCHSNPETSMILLPPPQHCRGFSSLSPPPVCLSMKSRGNRARFYSGVRTWPELRQGASVVARVIRSSACRDAMNAQWLRGVTRCPVWIKGTISKCCSLDTPAYLWSYSVGRRMCSTVLDMGHACIRRLDPATGLFWVRSS